MEIPHPNPVKAPIKVKIVPDGYFVLHDGEYEYHNFLEIDMGTETARSSRFGRNDYTRKILGYQAYHRSGKYRRHFDPDGMYDELPMRILTVTTSLKRLATLKAAAEAVGAGAQFWFTTFRRSQPIRSSTSQSGKSPAKQDHHGRCSMSLRKHPSMEGSAETMPSKNPPLPSKAELDFLAGALARRFILRWDLYGHQRDDGRYRCVRKPLRHHHLLDHLCGDLTLGTYLLDENSHSRILVFDADDEPDWRRLLALAKALPELGIDVYLEQSRRGGHLWLFLSELIPGALVRRFGQALMVRFGLGSLELFPKQDLLTGGLGR